MFPDVTENSGLIKITFVSLLHHVGDIDLNNWHNQSDWRRWGECKKQNLSAYENIKVSKVFNPVTNKLEPIQTVFIWLSQCIISDCLWLLISYTKKGLVRLYCCMLKVTWRLKSPYCIRIRTRRGIYSQILPFAWGSSWGLSPMELPKANVYIWSYLPSPHAFGGRLSPGAA